MATITLITFINTLIQLLMKINIEFEIELEIFMSTKSHLNMDIFVLHKYSKEKFNRKRNLRYTYIKTYKDMLSVYYMYTHLRRMLWSWFVRQLNH